MEQLQDIKQNAAGFDKGKLQLQQLCDHPHTSLNATAAAGFPPLLALLQSCTFAMAGP